MVAYGDKGVKIYDSRSGRLVFPKVNKKGPLLDSSALCAGNSRGYIMPFVGYSMANKIQVSIDRGALTDLGIRGGGAGDDAGDDAGNDAEDNATGGFGDVSENLSEDVSTSGAALLGLEFANVYGSGVRCVWGWGLALSYEMKRSTKNFEFTIGSVDPFLHVYLHNKFFLQLGLPFPFWIKGKYKEPYQSLGIKEKRTGQFFKSYLAGLGIWLHKKFLLELQYRHYAFETTISLDNDLLESSVQIKTKEKLAGVSVGIKMPVTIY